MITIRKILVPTDFSPHAQEAFRVAHDLAKAIGAGVVVFHVSRPPVVVSDGESALSTPADVEGKDVWERLRKIQPTFPRSASNMRSPTTAAAVPTAPRTIRR
jgi:nucleotide-binding universal stress UspA family protein